MPCESCQRLEQELARLKAENAHRKSEPVVEQRLAIELLERENTALRERVKELEDKYRSA